MEKQALLSVLEDCKKDLHTAYQSSSDNYRDVLMQRVKGRIEALITITKEGR